MHDHHENTTGHIHAFESPTMAAYAELEGEVLADLVIEGISQLAELCAQQGLEVRRVLDVGSGPGVGTCHLAQHFGSASVVAVDGSATMLEHVTVRAGRLGLGRRVETRLVELSAGLGNLGRAEVVWASMVLHHVEDAVAVLREIRQLLEPGGMVAIIEGGSSLQFLPDGMDLGRTGLWERLEAARAEWFTDMRVRLAGTAEFAGSSAMLAAAGFELLVARQLTMALDPPLDDRSRRLAHTYLARTRSQLDPHADVADLEALDVLIDEGSTDGILHRGDALLRATRHLYVARATQ